MAFNLRGRHLLSLLEYRTYLEKSVMEYGGP